MPASAPLGDVDFFPEYVGEKGAQKKVNPLFDVAPGIVFTGVEGDRLDMYKNLFPAGFDDVVQASGQQLPSPGRYEIKCAACGRSGVVFYNELRKARV